MIRILPPYWNGEELRESIRYLLGLNSFSGNGHLKEYLDGFLAPRRVILAESGRSALLLLFKYLKLDKKSKVLVPSFICPSVIDVILTAGLTPQYVDIDDTLAISAEDLEKKIDNSCQIVIMPHIYGKVCNILRIQQAVKKHNLILIDDAAAAFIPGKKDNLLGASGDFGIFSFNYKLASSVMGGGVICRKSEEAPLRELMESADHKSNGNYYRKIVMKHIYQRAGYRININLFPKKIRRGMGEDVNTVDYRISLNSMPSLTETIALIQLKKIKHITDRLNRNSLFLRENLKKNSNVNIVTSNFGDLNTRLVIKLNRDIPLNCQRDREEWPPMQYFRRYLLKRGVQSFSVYTPSHILSGSDGYLPRTEALWKKCLVIPNNPLYSIGDMTYLAETINRYDFSAQ